MKAASDKVEEFADLCNTPLVRLVGRLFWPAVVALAIYAGRAYMSDMIGSDPLIISIKADTVSAKATLAAHETFIQEQAITNSHLARFFDESRSSRDQVSNQLSTIIEHGVAVDQRLTRIENKIDNSPIR